MFSEDICPLSLYVNGVFEKSAFTTAKGNLIALSTVSEKVLRTHYNVNLTFSLQLTEGSDKEFFI